MRKISYENGHSEDVVLHDLRITVLKRLEAQIYREWTAKRGVIAFSCLAAKIVLTLILLAQRPTIKGYIPIPI